MLELKDEDNCLCGSGKSYAHCCKPFHDGELPRDANKLMRSRYTAYAIGKVDYIIETTHPDNKQHENETVLWAKDIKDFCEATTFEGLVVTDFSENGEEATVTFRAHLMQGDQDVSFSEKSVFIKEGGKWLYLSGEKL